MKAKLTLPDEATTFHCWSCKSLIEVAAHERGKKVRCPGCGTRQASPPARTELNDHEKAATNVGAVKVYYHSFLLALVPTVALILLTKNLLWYSAQQAGDLAEVTVAGFTALFCLRQRRTRGLTAFVIFGVLAGGAKYTGSWEHLHEANRRTIYAGCLKQPREDVEADVWGKYCSCWADGVLADFSLRELSKVYSNFKIGSVDPRLSALGERCAQKATES